MCQSLDSSIKSNTNKLAKRRPSANGLCAQKVRSTSDRPTTAMANPAGRPDGGPTINYGCLDKRRSWITLNWIILFSIISELFNFSSRSPGGRPNMLRFCNLNKINSSFRLFIYILITSSLINTSTIGKLNSPSFWLSIAECFICTIKHRFRSVPSTFWTFRTVWTFWNAQAMSS